MLNYKECHIDDFKKAMEQKNADVKTISSEYLYILYTKFMADARQCFYAGTTHESGIGHKSEKRAEAYKNELQSRGIDIL